MKKFISHLLLIIFSLLTICTLCSCTSTPSYYNSLSDEEKSVVDLVMNNYGKWSSCEKIKFSTQGEHLIFEASYTTSSKKAGDIGDMDIYFNTEEQKLFLVNTETKKFKYIATSKAFSFGHYYISNVHNLSDIKEIVALAYANNS